MKIKNYLTILLSIIAIVFLLCLGGYMTYLNADDGNPFKQTVTKTIEDANDTYGLGLDMEKVNHPTLPNLSDLDASTITDKIPFLPKAEETTEAVPVTPEKNKAVSETEKLTESKKPAETAKPAETVKTPESEKAPETEKAPESENGAAA